MKSTSIKKLVDYHNLFVTVLLPMGVGDFDQVAEMPYPSLGDGDEIDLDQEFGGLPQSICDCFIVTGQWEALAKER